MGDSFDSNSDAETVDVVLSVQSIPSSVDPPMDQWSSLEVIVPEANKKKVLCEAGLYEPGSGEICAKNVAMSNSSMFRHPYYNYPAILDPGIEVALLAPEPKVKYPDDGQALYLATCKEMNQCPVKLFYRGLHKLEIDLRYYGIHPNGFRAMALALQYNNTVEVLNLTDNFLNDDASYHMGNMLLTNKTITEINLRGCRIGHEGARRLLHHLPLNKTLLVLDLSYNQLGDEGMKHLANAIIFKISVKKLNLSYNNITGKGAAVLAESFETHNNFTHLDLSWNKIYSPGGHLILTQLSESTCLEVLNLSWNSLSGARVGTAMSHVVLCPTLSELNLSNNQLEGESLRTITDKLPKAPALKTLDLSYNPLSPLDAFYVLQSLTRGSKLKNILLENVFVKSRFLALLKQTKEKKSMKDLVVTYGGVVGEFHGTGPDPRELVLNRIVYVIKAKKMKADIALIVMQLNKDTETIVWGVKEFSTVLEANGVRLDEDLINELCDCFPAPKPAKSPKAKLLDLNLLLEYVKRKWPDKKLPPTPPPEPEPEPIPVPVAKPKSKTKRKK